MSPRSRSPRRTLLLLLLPLLLQACAIAPKPLPPLVVEPAAIPPLPAVARQPPIRSVCSPTCSDALTRERESWLLPPTEPASQASPASRPTTASAPK